MLKRASTLSGISRLSGPFSPFSDDDRRLSGRFSPSLREEGSPPSMLNFPNKNFSTVALISPADVAHLQLVSVTLLKVFNEFEGFSI